MARVDQSPISPSQYKTKEPSGPPPTRKQQDQKSDKRPLILILFTIAIGLAIAAYFFLMSDRGDPEFEFVHLATIQPENCEVRLLQHLGNPDLKPDRNRLAARYYAIAQGNMAIARDDGIGRQMTAFDEFIIAGCLNPQRFKDAETLFLSGMIETIPSEIGSEVAAEFGELYKRSVEENQPLVD